jgi:hypothetical protein
MAHSLEELRRRRKEVADQLRAYYAGEAPYWMGPNGPAPTTPEYATGLEATVAELDKDITEAEAMHA